MRNQRYKLIYYYGQADTWELVDLQEDPREYENIYDDPPYADVVVKMKADLSRLRQELQVGATP